MYNYLIKKINKKKKKKKKKKKVNVSLFAATHRFPVQHYGEKNNI